MARIEVTAAPAKCDLISLRQPQTPAPQASAPTRSDPARRSQPTAALLAIAAGCDRCIINELPSSHARPEHLIDLRNHPITEPHTPPPTRDVAITARTRASPLVPPILVQGQWSVLNDTLHDEGGAEALDA